MNDKTDIEKDILIIEDLIMYFKQTDNEEEYEKVLAIENILKDRERLLEENTRYRIQLNDAFSRGFIHKDKIKETFQKAREKAFNETVLSERDVEYIDNLVKIINEAEKELLDTKKEKNNGK